MSVCTHTLTHMCMCPFLAALMHKGVWEKRMQNRPRVNLGLKELPKGSL